MTTVRNTIMSSIMLGSVLIAGPAAAGRAKIQASSTSPHAAAVGLAASSTPPQEPPSPSKVVAYGERDVVKVRTKVRYTTLIVIPKAEQILDFTCGDKEFWIVNGAQNIAYVKPAKVGAQTNLNLVTASGNIYSFTLAEVSGDANSDPDLKVFVEPKEESMLAATNAKPRFVSAEQLDDYRQQVEMAKDETKRVKASAQEAIDAAVNKHIHDMRFPFRFEAGKKPFFVRAIYTDDKFTYIQARPEETPTLFELKDGKPNLVNFDYKNGIYVVDKILDKGYLVVGRERLAFARQE